jgi:hypothetical protein
MAGQHQPGYRRACRCAELEGVALHDNIGPGAGNDSLDLCLLALGDSEPVKSLLKIVQKGFPLYCRYDQVLAAASHGIK